MSINTRTDLQLSKGFTIIEVLIVLAIAALILLIVFLAVPALQRQQRNTGRKSDAGRVAAAIIDYESNSGNKFPQNANDCLDVANAADQANLNWFKGLGQGAGQCLYSTTPPAIGGPPSFRFFIYSPAVATILDMSGNPPDNSHNSQMILATQARCDSTDSSMTSITGVSPRNAALVYSIESGSSWAWACLNVQ